MSIIALATPDSTDRGHLEGIGELLVALLLSLLMSDTQGTPGETGFVVTAGVAVGWGTAVVAVFTATELGVGSGFVCKTGF